MKLIATKKSDQNQAAMDPWTIVHLGTGVALGLLGAKLAPTLLAGLAYEAGEQAFESSSVGSKFFATSGPETMANSVVDMVVYMAGWWLGHSWRESA
jgi:hypothetical protein